MSALGMSARSGADHRDGSCISTRWARRGRGESPSSSKVAFGTVIAGGLVGGNDARMNTRRMLVIGGALALAIASSGCSSGGGDDHGAPSSIETSTSAAAATSSIGTSASSSTTSLPTTTTIPLATSSSVPVPDEDPPGTDVAAVTPVLQSLVDRYDASVAAVLADPSVASEPANALVNAYLELFVPGAPFPATVVGFWAGEGEQGRFYRPGPRGQMYVSTVQSVQSDSADQVTFIVCTLKSIVIVDASGAELSAEGGQTAGSVVALRVDGIWLLRDLTRIAPEVCPDPRPQP